MAQKTIELNGEQFVIRNIGFVFKNFQGTVYRILLNRKFFKYKKLGDMCFSIEAFGSIDKGIIHNINKMLEKEHKEQETQRKIKDFEKTLDK